MNRGLVSLYAYWVDEEPSDLGSVAAIVSWLGTEGDTLWAIREEVEVVMEQECDGPASIDAGELRKEICAHMVALEGAEPAAARQIYCTLVRCLYCLIAVTDM